MKKCILAGILLCVMALSGCMLAEPTKKTSKEQEVAMQTEAGREAYIAEELYEGAEILSEIKNEETGFIVSEFMSGDYHSFVFFRPTEKGYAYNGEADDTLDGMVTVAYAPMGDGDYHVFLRHSEDIISGLLRIPEAMRIEIPGISSALSRPIRDLSSLLKIISPSP